MDSESTQSKGVVSVSADSALTSLSEIVVLDVRTPAEFAAGHVPGSINIDIDDPEFPSHVAELKRDGTFLVYCSANIENGRSARALEIM